MKKNMDIMDDEEFWKWFERRIYEAIKGSAEEDFNALLLYSAQPRNSEKMEEELLNYLTVLQLRSDLCQLLHD
jgi:hypothetical protein